MTAPNAPSAHDASMREVIHVAQPRILADQRTAPAIEKHVIEREIAEARKRVLAAADRDGITLAADPKAEVIIRVSAPGYERAKPDDLTDDQWKALVEAHDGYRPLAYVRRVSAATGDAP